MAIKMALGTNLWPGSVNFSAPQAQDRLLQVEDPSVPQVPIADHLIRMLQLLELRGQNRVYQLLQSTTSTMTRQSIRGLWSYQGFTNPIPTVLIAVISLHLWRDCLLDSLNLENSGTRMSASYLRSQG